METHRKIKLFKETFKGRRDVVASYWKKSNGKSGYSPLRFRGSGKYRGLSDDLLQNHFKGKMILGVYPMTRENTCHFIAADFDNHDGNKDPLRDATEYYETCAVNEIPCYLLRSKSGRGYHAYIFFENAVPASKARLVAKALLEEARLIGYESSFDRLFPSQDRLSGKGFGNLISLPFQGRASKKGCTLFLDPDAGFKEPFEKEDQAEVLANLEKVDESLLDSLIDEWDLKMPDHPETGRAPRGRRGRWFDPAAGLPRGGGAGARPREYGKDPGAFNSNFDVVYRECRFIAHCKDDSAMLPYLHWWAMISNVVRCRDGVRIVHALSRPYPGYDRSETDYQVRRALDFPYPLTCKYIRNNISPLYCQGCKYWNYIKNPAVLGIRPSRYATEWISIFHSESERDHIGCCPSEAKDEAYLQHEWRDSFDDMRGEDQAAFWGGPGLEVHAARVEGGYDAPSPEGESVYLQKYICAECHRPVIVSSDMTDQIVIHIHCKCRGRPTRAIFWKASNAFSEIR